MVPSDSLSTGISIFIDSIMASSCPFFTLSPSFTNIFHMLPAILALISFILLAPYYLFNILVVDRKSTRLNSSHVSISYAVFCLKKKKDVSFGRPAQLGERLAEPDECSVVREEPAQ